MSEEDDFFWVLDVVEQVEVDLCLRLGCIWPIFSGIFISELQLNVHGVVVPLDVGVVDLFIIEQGVPILVSIGIVLVLLEVLLDHGEFLLVWEGDIEVALPALVEKLSVYFRDCDEVVNNSQVFEQFEEVLNRDSSVKVLALGVVVTAVSYSQAAVFIPLPQMRVFSQQQVHNLIANNKPMA